MIYRLHLDDWRTIAYYLGTLVLMTAGFMLVPLALAIILAETPAVTAFMTGIGASGVAGALLMMCRVRPAELTWRQALIVTGLCWIVLSAFGAIPLSLSDNYPSYLDAFFETVSCFTTTGLSVCIDQDHMALSIVTWRCVMNIMGGVGVVVIALALGIFGSGSIAASLYQAEGRSGHVMPEIRQTARFIFRVSSVIIGAGTVACAAACLLLGMEPYRAVLNGFFLTASDYTTGGMTAQSAGIVYYHCWPLELITMVVMVFSCINFLLYGDLWKGVVKTFFKDIEVRTIAVWVSLLVLLMMLALSLTSYFTGLGSMLRRGLYEVMSAAFNIGYSTLYPGQLLYAMGTGALFVVILGMCIGGSASSISGGIKALRVGIIVKSIVQTIRTAIAPDRARPRTFFNHRGRQLLTPGLVSGAMTILLMYIVTYAIGAVAGIVYGYDALPAIFESVSAASNTGLTLGIASASMPEGLELVYIVEMWLGRLEFIAFFAMVVELVFTFVPRRHSSARRRRGRSQRRGLGGLGGFGFRGGGKTGRRGGAEKHGRGDAAGCGHGKVESGGRVHDGSSPCRSGVSGAGSGSGADSGAASTSGSGAGSRLAVFAAFALAASLSCAPAALATSGTGSTGGANGDAEADIGTLSNRYELLSELGNADTDDSDVVVETRVGVLTRVNRALDGAVVRVQGEAVGDKLAAGDGHVWVNILGSSGSSMGVYMSDEQARAVTCLGDYNNTGTVIVVTGVYAVACHEHQGELDLHAQSVEVLDVGGAIEHGADLEGSIGAVVLCMAAFALLGLFAYLRFWRARAHAGKRSVRVGGRAGKGDSAAVARADEGAVVDRARAHAGKGGAP